MIAARLLQRIETNWEQIGRAVMLARNQDPELPHYKNLSDDEIRLRVRDLTTNLARWMANPHESRSAEYFEQLGRRRYLEGTPLHEVLLKLTVLKRAIQTYASDQNYSLTPMEIYHELELLRAMATYFDLVVFRVAKGYEEVARQDREFARRRTT